MTRQGMHIQIEACGEESGCAESAKRPEVLALIPARGGSKGVPHKNIRHLGGLPLVAHSIKVALSARLVTRVVVSTDDRKIAEVARKHGADVPFMRPDSLATDKALVGDCIDHALSELRKTNYVPDAIAVLYPTHPFRTPETVDFLVSKLLEGHSPVVAAKCIDAGVRRYVSLSDDGHLVTLQPGTPGQINGFYKQYRGSGFFDGRLFRVADNPYVHTLANPISLIDIDTERDLALAEEVIRQDLFDFKGAVL